MLICGDQVRFTRREIEELIDLTDFSPAWVKSMADLRQYVAQCKEYYWGTSRETRDLHANFDRLIAMGLGYAAW